MEDNEARNLLRELGVEIDSTDNRSHVEILAFIQGLAVNNAGAEISEVEVTGESSII